MKHLRAVPHFRNLTSDERDAVTRAVLIHREAINAELASVGIVIEDVSAPDMVVTRVEVQE